LRVRVRAGQLLGVGVQRRRGAKAKLAIHALRTKVMNNPFCTGTWPPMPLPCRVIIGLTAQMTAKGYAIPFTLPLPGEGEKVSRAIPISRFPGRPPALDMAGSDIRRVKSALVGKCCPRERCESSPPYWLNWPEAC
jgi:hypothetical protein